MGRKMASFKQCGPGCKLKMQQNQKAKDCLSNLRIQKKMVINGNVDEGRQVCCRKRIKRDYRQNSIKQQVENEREEQSQKQERKEIQKYETQNSEGNKFLTYQHMEQFKRVYSLVGSNWTRILRILNEEHQIFLGSSADELKNLFCNSMRKVAKLFENQNWNTQRRMVKNAKSYLLSMLQIVNQADKIMLENGLKPNPQSLMQKFKSHLLSLCFDPDNWSQQVVSELLEATKYLGKKMKCFGIFKVKNKKNWKLTEQSFRKMRQFENITLNDLDSHIDSFEIDSLMEQDEKLKFIWMERSFLKTQVKLRLIEEEKDGINHQNSLNFACDQSRSFMLF